MIYYASVAVAPRLQKGILDSRHREIAEPTQPPAKGQSASVESRIVYALKSHTELSDDFIAASRKESESDPEAWSTYVATVNYIFNQRATNGRQLGIIGGKVLENPWLEPDPDKISVCTAANEARMKSVTTINPSPGDVFGLRGSHEEDLATRWPSGVHGCRLVVDGMSHIRNVILFDLIIDYSGGPIQFTNARFDIARLRLLRNNANTRKLADELVRSKDNVITLNLR